MLVGSDFDSKHVAAVAYPSALPFAIDSRKVVKVVCGDASIGGTWATAWSVAGAGLLGIGGIADAWSAAKVTSRRIAATILAGFR
jgi:hypothetical protein